MALMILFNFCMIVVDSGMHHLNQMAVFRISSRKINQGIENRHRFLLEHVSVLQPSSSVHISIN